MVKGSVIIEYRDINDRILKDNALVHYNAAVDTAYNAEESEHRTQTIVGYDGKTYKLAPAGTYKVGEVDEHSHLVSSAPMAGRVVGNTNLIVTYVYQEVTAPSDTPDDSQSKSQTDAEKITPIVSHVRKPEGELSELDVIGAVAGIGQGTVQLAPGMVLPTRAGEYDISVIVTYPDKSRDELVVPVTLTLKTDTQKTLPQSSIQDSEGSEALKVSDQSQSQAKTELTDRKSQKDLPKTGSESSTTGFWSGILTLVAGLAIVRKNKKSE